MKKMRCAVIGVGYLGNFHADKYFRLEQAELIAVCDNSAERAAEIAEKYNAKAVTDYTKLIGQVDAVSIVTPTTTHHSVAKFFLENGVHVLLEKPITETVAQANELITIAKQNNLALQIGHLERFNNVLKEAEKVVRNPRFIESHRLATFNPRGTDVNVMLDLMIHDIDIIQHLVKSPITEIRANGVPILTSRADIANARIEFESGCVANVTASRVSFRSERRLRLFQPDAYITLDLDTKHMSLHQRGEGEMFPGIPKIVSREESFERGDAILDEIISFLDAIKNGTTPEVTGEDGRDALDTAIRITTLVRKEFTKEFAKNLA